MTKKNVARLVVDPGSNEVHTEVHDLFKSLGVTVGGMLKMFHRNKAGKIEAISTFKPEGEHGSFSFHYFFRRKK